MTKSWVLPFSPFFQRWQQLLHLSSWICNNNINKSLNLKFCLHVSLFSIQTLFVSLPHHLDFLGKCNKFIFESLSLRSWKNFPAYPLVPPTSLRGLLRWHCRFDSTQQSVWTLKQGKTPEGKWSANVFYQGVNVSLFTMPTMVNAVTTWRW